MRLGASVARALDPRAAKIRVRHCEGLAECERCLELQREAWGFEDKDAVPVPLFVVALRTGGQVLGAFDGDTMIGFTLAVAGWRDRHPMLHSHMTAVLDAYRNYGIGGRLKLFQRDDALARGIRLIEWTFDPLQAKNGYFNLVRLGAIVRRIQPNLYGITSSPLHGNLPTDRLVAEWHLASARARRALENSPGGVIAPRRKGQFERIRIPKQIDEWKRTNYGEALRAQAEIRGKFERLFARGWVATGLEPGDEGSDYILEKI